MKVLLTGDSHVTALRKGERLIDAAERPSGIDITLDRLWVTGRANTPFFIDNGDHARVIENDTSPRAHFDIPPRKVKYEAIGLSMPFHTARVWSKDWSCHAIWPDPGHEKILISSGLAKTIFDNDSASILGLIDVIARTTSIFVIESPAPFAYHPSFDKNGKEMISRVHSRYREYLYGELSSRNVPVVENDPSWLDCLGLMNPDLVGRFEKDGSIDSRHGSEQYGRMMMLRVYSFLREWDRLR